MRIADLLERTGSTIARRPVPILAASAVLIGLGLWSAASLGVETDMAKLLPEDNRTAKSFTEISDAFSTTSLLAVAVEGGDRESTIRAAEAFAEKLKTDGRTASLVKSVRVSMDREFVDRWGFMLQDADELSDSERTLRSARLVPLLGAVNTLMEEKLSDGDDEEVEGAEGEDDATALMTRFALFAEGLRAAIEGPSDEAALRGAAEKLAEDFLLGDRYFFDPEGRTLLMTVSPTFDIGVRESLVALMDGARLIAAETGGASFRFAGDVASEADEEDAIGADLFYPSLISVVVILSLFFFSFNRFRSILFATIALVAGIVVDLGFAALTVGKLNMITSSFGALLVGLGIDFGIHIASRYDTLTDGSASPESALAEIFGTVVRPVAIGAFTTAIAFYALCFSRTVAFRQFGLIAGTGILITLLAATTALPALLVAFPGRRVPRSGAGTRSRRRAILTYRTVARAAAFSARARWFVLPAAAAATVSAAFFVPRNSFEYDMRRIGPQGTASQATENLIGERFGISTYQALAVAPDLESARALAERMKDAPLVRRVESLADHLPSPEDQDERRTVVSGIAANRGRVGVFRWDADAVAALAEEVGRLEMNLIELGDLAAASLGEDSMPVRARTATIREIYGAERGASGKEVYARLADALESDDAAQTAGKLARIDAAFAEALDRRVSAMAAVDRRMTEADLPPDILDDFRSPEGNRYLVVAQPSRGLSGDEAIVRFSDGLREADPGATGTLLLGVELSREMLGETRIFAVVVFVLILALVAWSFRSLGAVVVVSVPFFMSLVWTFGIYPAFGRFNIVNALSLPLLLGVGIDYAVHFYSALRAAPPRAAGTAEVEASLAGTGKAVALSALTTIVGFGSLAFAGRFRGIADLGLTLLIGISCCLVSAVLVLPAAEAVLRKKSRPGAAESSKKTVKEAI